ncbi:hypothetical protein [Bradyrhizobium sp. NAS96.2]|uniref:hypothetical protein n=1 Tax=Bradyrhizobium sp. NAS96.2 TaxID=1680160 RepID=UPI001160E6B0|nr:hypothetical protein [Bradyrhizobium sp. NAS96.2]
MGTVAPAILVRGPIERAEGWLLIAYRLANVALLEVRIDVAGIEEVDQPVYFRTSLLPEPTEALERPFTLPRLPGQPGRQRFLSQFWHVYGRAFRWWNVLHRSRLHQYPAADRGDRLPGAAVEGVGMVGLDQLAGQAVAFGATEGSRDEGVATKGSRNREDSFVL